MKESLLRLLDFNPGKSFVVMVYTEQELNEVMEVLRIREFVPASPISLDEFKNNAMKVFGFPVGFKLNQVSLLISFQCLEHWKIYTNDIVRYNGVKFEFVE